MPTECTFNPPVVYKLRAAFLVNAKLKDGWPILEVFDGVNTVTEIHRTVAKVEIFDTIVARFPICLARPREIAVTSPRDRQARYTEVIYRER